MSKKKLIEKLLYLVAVIIVLLIYWKNDDISYGYSSENIPSYNGKNYVILDNNIPNFNENDNATESFEIYSDLDYLGRAGVAYANVGIDLMPTEKRESIGSIKPTGWQISKYDFIDGKYLYNRCHLIAYQLTSENANEKNLITCTRQMNSVSMLEFENRVANYIKRTKNHVLYRVTPMYLEDNLLASGVQMEAFSVEDNGKGIKFNVFVFNVQDKIEIDYKNGNNKLKK